MKRFFKAIIFCFAIILALLLLVICFFTMGKAKVSKNITWGVDFSQMQAESLSLDWKQAFLAIINDLGVKNIKLHTQWDWVEGVQGKFYFEDIDWQLQQAKQNGAKIIYVLGMKSGRWPECHIPTWAQGLSEQQQKEAILNYITEVVKRYKGNKAIIYWQVENEPFLKFGQCPSWYDKDAEFIKQEVALVKSLDPSRQVIVSESGELSLWTKAAKVADVVGVTMYRKAWLDTSTYGLPIDGLDFYATYPFSPAFYARKAGIIKTMFNKKVMCVELQAEPWGPKPIYNSPLSEQYKTMNPDLFLKNVEFAKETGLDTFYFWGAEWWYWLKEKQDQPQIWQEAQKLFQT